MDTIVIVPATMEHAASIGARMRQVDVDECWATAQLPPADTVRLSLENSIMAWTWLEDGEPVCIWGYACQSLVGDHGIPWLLTTDLVERHPIKFLRNSRIVLDIFHSRFRHLENYVDARHVACLRWLRWLGFTIHPAAPFGPLGLPFHHFERTS